MNTGSFVRQGTTHITCQDYAVHGEGYVILADGCSTAPDTDFGSRLLVKAYQRLHAYPEEASQDTIKMICGHAEQLRDSLQLPIECLRSTLVSAELHKDLIHVSMYGDGVIFQKKKDGTIWVQELKYTSGAPFYPIYLVEEGAVATYLERFDNKATVTTYTGKFDGYDQTKEDLELPIPVFQDWKKKFPVEETEFLAIMSDGASSFYQLKNQGTSKYTDPIPLMQVLQILMDFPGYQNLFVVNQCHWLFEKDTKGTFKRLGWKNSDDLSVGVIYCGE